MVSVLREALVMLFRDCPQLAPELLRGLGTEIAHFVEARIDSSDLGQVVPTEYRADLVVVLYDAAGEPVLAMAIEVQLRPDERKRYTWPIYVTTLRGRHECPALVLVIAPTEDVAAWASTPIELGISGEIHPYVLAPAMVPSITDPAEARRRPELAVLSATAHANDPPAKSSAIAIAAIAAMAGLDEERAGFYADLIDAELNEAARAALEREMQKYEPQGPFAKRHFAEGRIEGRAEGRTEGRAEGRAEAILVLLESRGVFVPEETRTRILGCRDLPTLDRWLLRGATGASIADVIDD